MPNTVVLDLFLGDSGKGKIVDYLAESHKSVVRFSGSNNAGHTIEHDGRVIKTHALPSGILHPHIINFIGHGCTIDPEVLVQEIQENNISPDKLRISGGAHIIQKKHIELDIEREKKFSIGSTKRGVAPAAEDKYARRGTLYSSLKFNSSHLGLILPSYIEEDGVAYMQDVLIPRGDILFEGAQGTFLDIDVGEYPYVTSSNTTIGAVLTGTGVNMNQVDEVIGVIKAYGSYVGTNPKFKDIQEEELNERLCDLGQEYGATTGRRRRLCWLDLDKIKRAAQINGPTKLAVTRMDTLGQMPKIFLRYNDELQEFEPWGDLKGVESVSDLPESAQNYLRTIEKILNVPIWAVGIGPSRRELLVK